MPKPKTEHEALMQFIAAIEETGGVSEDESGIAHPLGDFEWTDIGGAYIDACEVLGRLPMIEKYEDSEEEEDFQQ